jgi:hypothetical protein
MANPWTYDELLAGREKAKAANDENAVRRFNQKLEETPEYHRDWIENAAKDGNEAAAERIAGQYWSKRGDIKGKDLDTDPVFQRYSRKLYEATEGKPFEGDDAQAGQYGLDLMRDLESNDWKQGSQLWRWSQGEIGEEEKRALRVLGQGYDQSGASLEGAGAHLWNMVQSPSTYIGGGILGKGAKKAAMKPLMNQIQKGVIKEGAEKGVERAARELAEGGVRTLGQRAKTGAKVGAAEGAIYTGVADAAAQSYQNEDDEYDVGRGVGAAATGAVVGAPVGAIAGAAFNRSGKAIKEAREQVAGTDLHDQGALTRIMDAALQRNPSPGALDRAKSGDIVGAYREHIATRGPLSSDEMYDVFKNAGFKAEREFLALQDEVKDIAKRYGISKNVIREVTDARRLAKKRGVRPNEIGTRLQDTKGYQKLPEKVQNKLNDDLGKLGDTAREISDIAQFAADTFGKRSAAEEIFTAPEVNVLADVVPRGYVATRGLGRVLGMKRVADAPKRFHQVVDSAAKLDPERAIGPETADAMRDRMLERGTVAEVGDAAEAAGERVAAGKWKARAAKDSAKRQGRRRLKQAELNNEYIDPDRVGGVTLEWANRLRAHPRQMRSILKEVQKDFRKQADEAAVAGDRKREKYLRKLADNTNNFKQFYDRNINTSDGFVTGDKGAERDLYFTIQQAATDWIERQDVDAQIKAIEENMEFLRMAAKHDLTPEDMRAETLAALERREEQLNELMQAKKAKQAESRAKPKVKAKTPEAKKSLEVSRANARAKANAARKAKQEAKMAPQQPQQSPAAPQQPPQPAPAPQAPPAPQQQAAPQRSAQAPQEAPKQVPSSARAKLVAEFRRLKEKQSLETLTPEEKARLEQLKQLLAQ